MSGRFGSGGDWARLATRTLLATTPLTDGQIRDAVRRLTAEDSPALADNVIDRDEIEKFLLGDVESALDDVAALVILGFEAWRSSTAGTSSHSVGEFGLRAGESRR